MYIDSHIWCLNFVQFLTKTGDWQQILVNKNWRLAANFSKQKLEIGRKI
jgi:hypothetical protein